MKDYQTKRFDRKRTPERVPQGFFEAFASLYGEPRSKLSEMPLSETAASHGYMHDRAS